MLTEVDIRGWVWLQGYRSTKVAWLQLLIRSLMQQRPAQYWETTEKNLCSSKRVNMYFSVIVINEYATNLPSVKNY